MKKALFIAFVCLSSWAFSQTPATLSGKVADAGTGETLAGASILIEGTNQQLMSDLNGYFDLSSLQPGTYTLVCQYLSYTNKKLEVEIKAGETTFVQIDLQGIDTDIIGSLNTTANQPGSSAAISK
jgi:outer membrane receptor for ferrienterochelin and colicins